MREIKFRGQRQSDNKWIYGDLLQPIEICDIYEISDCESIDGSRYDVVEDTIGQYTGLKDKNGKEIYEGDILQDKDCIYKVIFEYGSFDGKIIEVLRNVGTQKGMTYQLSFIISDNDNIKVIGNIYENPELLEDK